MTLAEKELLVRNALLAACLTVPKIGKVYGERDYSGSEHQFVARHGERNQSSKQIEVKSSVVELVGFEDVDNGADECPFVYLIYRIHLFHGFIEKRPDGSNSTNDHVSVYLALRDKFLDREVLGLEGVECEPLTVSQPAIVADDEGFSEAYGHSIDFQLKVLVSCNE